MPASVAGLRFPATRVLLPRTRLAYVHLRNLLNDAKRDRSARVSGYVAIWLPEELQMLYLVRGELVNAACCDRVGWHALPIARALEKVPAEPEYGEICFHEADEAQLACMFAAQSRPPEPWPGGMMVTEPSILFPYLMATTFDGAVEIVADDTVNYLRFHHGAVERAFLATNHHGTVIDRVAKLFAREGRLGDVRLSRWSAVESLPTQAPPALHQAYRELLASLVQRLVDQGRESAPAIAEHARTTLIPAHPALDGISFNGRVVTDAVVDTAALTSAVAALIREILWAAADHAAAPPAELLRELTWERRHMFQSAGLYDRLEWKVL